MCRLIAAFAVVGACAFIAGCGGGDGGDKSASKSTTSPTTTTTTAPPVAEKGLKGLLLTPEEINPVMEATDMAITQRHDALSDDSATMEPEVCLAVDGAAQAKVYAGSGYTAVREQTLSEGDDFAHYVDQAVVLFPSAKQATAFFDVSAKQWPSCDEYTHTQSGSQWTTGPVSNSKGVLSVTATQENAGAAGWACGRALAARNNIVVDVNTCSADPKDTASTIVSQIADKVPMQ
jgi:hypothetical protein